MTTGTYAEDDSTIKKPFSLSNWFWGSWLGRGITRIKNWLFGGNSFSNDGTTPASHNLTTEGHSASSQKQAMNPLYQPLTQLGLQEDDWEYGQLFTYTQTKNTELFAQLKGNKDSESANECLQLMHSAHENAKPNLSHGGKSHTSSALLISLQKRENDLKATADKSEKCAENASKFNTTICQLTGEEPVRLTVFEQSAQDALKEFYSLGICHSDLATETTKKSLFVKKTTTRDESQLDFSKFKVSQNKKEILHDMQNQLIAEVLSGALENKLNDLYGKARDENAETQRVLSNYNRLMGKLHIAIERLEQEPVSTLRPKK